MDKQKSYGEKYSTIKFKRRLSARFVFGTLFCCVSAVVLCYVFVRG
ncbi:MAG: hypothetical protein J6J24_04015 [Clostridia bacterium]|nr:hypothetical protein [Clostridia bacterium]